MKRTGKDDDSAIEFSIVENYANRGSIDNWVN